MEKESPVIKDDQKKILIVDDNEFQLTYMQRAFEFAGYECFTALRAEDAFDLLEKITPDIILSDYKMPETNGFEFRKQLLLSPSAKHIPFVFFTSNTDNDIAMKGLQQMHAVDFINKETPLNVIISKLDNIITAIKEKTELNIEELNPAYLSVDIKSKPTEVPFIKDFFVDYWQHSHSNSLCIDFIDFIPAKNENSFIVLGNVMAEENHASFLKFGYLVYTRAVVRLCMLDNNFSAGQILKKINTVICQDDNLKDIQSKLAILFIDQEENTITYSGAGEMPLFYYDAVTESLTKTALPELNEASNYDEKIFTLNQGDKLLLCSDGLINDENKDSHDGFEKSVQPLLQSLESSIKLKEFFVENSGNNNQVNNYSFIFLEKKL